MKQKSCRGYAANCRDKRDSDDSKVLMDIERLDQQIQVESLAVQSLLEERETVIEEIKEYGLS